MRPKVSYYLSKDSGVIRVYEILSVKDGNPSLDRNYTVKMKFLAILASDECRMLDEFVHVTNGDLEDLEKGNQDPSNVLSKRSNWKHELVPIVFDYDW